jgi:hypothetical protein
MVREEGCRVQVAVRGRWNYEVHVVLESTLSYEVAPTSSSLNSSASERNEAAMPWSALQACHVNMEFTQRGHHHEVRL